MTNNPYQVFGVGTPQMIGRDSLYRELVRRLDKPTPDNVSLVGPRHFGKSIILRHLYAQFRDGWSNHADVSAAYYWDLSGAHPSGDTEFLRHVCRLTKDALSGRHVVESEFIDVNAPEFDQLWEALKYVHDELLNKGTWVLGIIDGLERPLTEEALTNNLWANLRHLASESSLRLITGTRHSIMDLCTSEGARDSHFHMIFNTAPIQVGRFSDQDWPGVFTPLSTIGVEITEPAKKELLQWTGAVPTLTAAVLEALYATCTPDSPAGHDEIVAAAERTVASRRDLLKQLWDDCSPHMQADLRALQEREVRREELSADRQHEHEFRGFAGTSGGKLISRCRMMDVYARQQEGGLSEVRRLFGDDERFQQNIRALLEARLAVVRNSNVARAYPLLLQLVERAVADVREPVLSISLFRSIRDRALEVIWKLELPGNVVPHSWLSELKSKWIEPAVPSPSGASVRLLQLATGDFDVPRLTKLISKRTYVLVNLIHSVGDHGQHSQAEELSWSYAALFCMAAIELVESLSLDLTQPPSTLTTSANSP